MSTKKEEKGKPKKKEKRSPKVTDYGFKEERAELDKMDWGNPAKFKPTGYPKPLRRYRFIHQIFHQSIEEMYYWVHNFITQDFGFSGGEDGTDKITDVFASGVNSAFFGNSASRLSIQQDRVSSYLATIGKLIKEMFQVVRELRLLDERLDLYHDSWEKNDHSAEITLKGYWVDFVEGGAKNPASVYGMAANLGFTVLPDLFFGAPILKKDQVDNYVDGGKGFEGLDFNAKVKEVLKRKLKTYLNWKHHTSLELESRKKFTVKYLRQHYNSIKLYIDWLKPYLKNVKRLSMDQGKMDSSHLIKSFDSTMIEIEILFKKKVGKAYAVVIGHWMYRTAPQMNYNVEYQRGPQHMGLTEMTLRAYSWTKEEIEKYKAYRQAEEVELLGDVSEMLTESMEFLGEDLEKFLKEAGERFADDEEEETQERIKANKKLLEGTKGFLDPFVSIFKGLGDLAGAFRGNYAGKVMCNSCGTINDTKDSNCSNCGASLRKPTRQESFDLQNSKKQAEGLAKVCCWLAYKFYKKGHRFLAW